ncbi:MAG: tRNA (adenosine(37)-N6)-dimethylallyltransferase MiaA [Candidatus Bipolaricaulota bacterium]|nr:tRNA (adenosine(37)-N6)-dimethylallyltransferase MiaA [Candidatus Bipolaricaulota bacterium]
MKSERPVLILGPTATGKSALAVALAERLDGEIISADARAIYRELNIGTAKPPPHLRALVPHHLIDFLDPSEHYDVMQFRRDALTAIEEIRARGKFPIVVGGSTLYISALTGTFFAGPKADPQIRQRLEAEPQEKLRARLEEIDPEAARRIHPNDKVRTVRALEVYELTGLPISRWHKESKVPFPYQFTKIGLTLDRTVLYERINARVEQMLAAGLLEEAKALKAKLTPEMPAYRTIGYEELFQYLDGKISYDEAVRLIKKHTREYAKRQIIYFKRELDVHWIDVTGRAPEEVLDEVLAILQKPSNPL